MNKPTLTPCKFTFDDSKAFDGFAHGSKWNGFDNVAVTPEVRDDIAHYFDGGCDDILEIEPMENGLISLGWGYTTTIVDDFADVLKVLADNDGACLYWQMPNVERGKAAAAEGIVRWDGDLLVHPDAVEVEREVAYTMPLKD